MTKNKVWDILENGPKTWSAQVQDDPDNPDECMLVFPQDLLDRVGWEVDDNLFWDVQIDGTIILRKV